MIQRVGYVALLVFGVIAGSLQAQNSSPFDIPPEWLEKYPGIKRSAELKNKPRLDRRDHPAYPDDLR
ncbi:MAG: hypothetical protein HOH58_11305 [Opitutaceae bacterium]|jgi:hypothetical protein|nr:hypothetical protein [Opitutaceae bacterium]